METTITATIYALVIENALRQNGLPTEGVHANMTFNECVDRFYAGDRKAAFVDLMFHLMATGDVA